jgi:hypothetical protein
MQITPRITGRRMPVEEVAEIEGQEGGVEVVGERPSDG